MLHFRSASNQKKNERKLNVRYDEPLIPIVPVVMQDNYQMKASSNAERKSHQEMSPGVSLIPKSQITFTPQSQPHFNRKLPQIKPQSVPALGKAQQMQQSDIDPNFITFSKPFAPKHMMTDKMDSDSQINESQPIPMRRVIPTRNNLKNDQLARTSKYQMKTKKPILLNESNHYNNIINAFSNKKQVVNGKPRRNLQPNTTFDLNLQKFKSQFDYQENRQKKRSLNQTEIKQSDL